MCYDGHDPLITPLVRVLVNHPKRIVFPDGCDLRVLTAAAALAKLECVAPILLGSRREIHALAAEHGIDMSFTGVVEPVQSADFPGMCERYRRVARIKRIAAGIPEEVMSRPPYYGAMMVQYGFADGLVGGNQTMPASWFRALLHSIPRMPGVDSCASCLPLHLPQRPDLGSNGTFFLADCAVIPSPTVSQLANIAVESARLAGLLLREKPRVALISSSTRGSTRNASTEKVLAATALALQRSRAALIDAEIDGELEVDAAIDPAVAAVKAPSSPLAGRANVLVFPSLESAHSAYKLLECVSGAATSGQHVIGLTRPATQVSRTSTSATIFRAAVTTAYRALSFREMLQAEPDV